MNRFKKSKYLIIVFVTVLAVSVLLVTTYSSAIVTKLGDGISLVDRIVQKPFQWFDTFKSDLGHLTPVSYTHLRAHETPEHLVCRLLLEKKK